MVTWVFLNKLREFSWSCPVKTTAIDNHSSNSRTMSANKLGRRVNGNIYTVRKDINQVRCGKGIIRNKWNLVFMRNLSQFFQVRNVNQGVTQGFNQNKLGIVIDSCFHFLQIIHIDKGCCDTITRKGFFQEIESPTVNSWCCHHVVTSMGKRQNRISHCGHTWSCCKSSNTTFKSSDSFFKGSRCRICNTSIDVAWFSQGKKIGTFLRIVKNKRCCLINRHCTRLGSWIHNLTSMQL